MWNLGSGMQQWHGSVWLKTNTDVQTNEGVRYHASKQMKQIKVPVVSILEKGTCSRLEGVCWYVHPTKKKKTDY